MKKLILIALTLFVLNLDLVAQEYKIVTTVESVVPMGVGRSRIIENQENKDSEALTTQRGEDGKTDEKKSRRRDSKVHKLKETKILNFYSAFGINFENIASNDAVMTDKINLLIKDGWELVHVVGGVESNAGETDNTGIFITRYIFRRD